ncbi:MAG: hypothetical protein FWC56_04885, partial [Phycisphaerae bacterium]|nr:hypothetical protein [Phycisphaerae bacterium]
MGTSITPTPQGICGLSVIKRDSVFTLVRLEDGKILKEWGDSNWYCSAAGSSRNGNFMALFMSRNRLPFDRNYVDLIDMRSQERRTIISELVGGSSARTVLVTDDGRHIAIVGGVNGGTTMIDAKEGKELWDKRPEGEIVSYYGAFSPDEKTI